MTAHKTRLVDRGAAFVAVALAAAVLVAVAAAIPPDRMRNIRSRRLVPMTDADLRAPIGLSTTEDVIPESVERERREAVDERNNTVVAAVTTGGDDCNDAMVVPVTAGPSGSPNTFTITGDSSAATGPDCGGLGTVWWEAFDLDRCADVTIDFCGSSPIAQPSYVILASQCAVDGSTCGGFFFWDGSDGNPRDECPGFPADTNITMHFSALPAGTYYYPIIASGNPPNVPGPYVMHITAEECVGICSGCLGACCQTDTQTCTENVAQQDCNGAQQTWHARAACCEVECRDPAAEYDALDAELLSHVPIGDFTAGSVEANDVWGYVSPRGRKFGIIGLTSSTGFVDITDPRNPVVIADIPDATSTWSDMAVYKEYAYNVNESGGGMQILDLTDIDNGNVTLLGSATGGMQTAHNVYVNPQSGRAYACGTDIAQGFVVYDLSDPADPQPVGTWAVEYVHDLYVVNYDSCPSDPPHVRSGLPCEIAFCFNGGAGMRILDVTDPTSIISLSSLTYPTLEYCHQGWLSQDRRYVFFDDELDELFGAVGSTRTYVADVQNLSSPSLVHTFDHPGCWIDHNLIPRGDRIYHAHYSAGLRVVDASNPLGLSEIAYFDTHPEDNVQDFVGAWGVYPFPERRITLISDIERGLFVLCDEPHRSVPCFTVEQNPAPCRGKIMLDASGSTTCDPARSIVAYEWDFDYDGVTFNVDATGVTASHSFSSIGVHTVALRVTDDVSAQEITTLDVEVADCIPAVSEWGLVALALLVATAGTVGIQRRYRADASA